jgi:predicted Zn-ribbon and HTH transcriptional regulator
MIAGMRRAFTILSCVSIVLVLPTTCLWNFACSHPVYHLAVVWSDSGTKIAETCKGFGFDDGGFLLVNEGRTWQADYAVELENVRRQLQRFGPESTGTVRWSNALPVSDFVSFGGPKLTSSSGRRTFVSLWSLMIAEMQLPVLSAIFWLRRQLQRRQQALVGHCVSCGYDLRASSQRCPECGTPFTRSEA